MTDQLGLFSTELLPEPPPAVGAAVVPPHLRSVAARLPNELRLGTSSWSFPGWEGIVFDRRTSQATLAREGLGAYARHPLLRTVGVDRTYYRPIPAADFRAYADAVPDDFRFVVKADRRVTAPIDPEAYGVRTDNPLFLDASYATEEVIAPTLEGLGPKAGPILFQFSPLPPNLVGGRGRFLDRLERFLAGLPEGPLYAVELRTPAFLGERYLQVLESTAAVHCYNVHPAMSGLDRQLEVAQPFYQRALIVRWMLGSGLAYEVARDRYAPFDRLVDEDAGARERIAVAALDALLGEREVFVIANNKAEGSAPLSVFKLAERIAAWGDHNGPRSNHTRANGARPAP